MELTDTKREMFRSIFGKRSVQSAASAEEKEIQKILESRSVPPKQFPKTTKRAYQYVTGGHAQQCVDRNLELAKKTTSS